MKTYSIRTYAVIGQFMAGFQVRPTIPSRLRKANVYLTAAPDALLSVRCEMLGVKLSPALSVFILSAVYDCAYVWLSQGVYCDSRKA